MKNETIKTLLRREKELISEIEDIKGKKKEIDKNLEIKRKKLEGVKAKIANAQESVIISEHAVIRYIERVLGINLKEIEALILDKPTEKIINTTQNGKINKDGFRLIFKNKQIVTVEVD